MKRLYTAESVTEGHPDKVCDRIADTILDACLAKDPDAHVACEVLATKGTVLLAGEISSSFEPDVLSLAEEVVEQVGYDPKAFLFDALIHRQSPDIAGGIQKSREKRGNPAADEEWSMGAGDQGIMTGYACRETPQMLPMPVVLANRIVRELDAARKSRFIKGILPDGKAQVTVEYEDQKPVRLDTVIVSCQHAEEKPLKELEREIRQKVLKPALHLLPADDETKIIINPSGRFVVGGMEADTGMTKEIFEIYTGRLFEKEMQPGCFNAELLAIVQFYNFLLVRGEIANMPFRPNDYLQKRVDVHHDRSVEEDVSREIISKLRYFPEHLRLLYLHLWGIGLRASEVCTQKGNAYEWDGMDA